MNVSCHINYIIVAIPFSSINMSIINPFFRFLFASFISSNLPVRATQIVSILSVGAGLLFVIGDEDAFHSAGKSQ